MIIGNGQFLQGDCLELMRDIPDGSVDMVLCDLPYGTTACSWDEIIPFEPLWEQYWRVCKQNAAVVLTASQPFTTALISSQMDRFKYCWVWEKTRATGHVHAKNKPMKSHEDVCVFSNGTTVHASQSKTRMTYNPQGTIEVNRTSFRPSRGKSGSDVVGSLRPSHTPEVLQTATGYPRSVLRIASEHNVGSIHPTQKPVALFEYLIRTYTNEGEHVLDNTAGSGTTAIAAENAGRRWTCMERDPTYYEAAIARVFDHVSV